MNFDLRTFACAVFLMGGRSGEQTRLQPAASAQGLEMEVGSKLQDSVPAPLTPVIQTADFPPPSCKKSA